MLSAQTGAQHFGWGFLHYDTGEKVADMSLLIQLSNNQNDDSSQCGNGDDSYCNAKCKLQCVKCPRDEWQPLGIKCMVHCVI